VEEQARDGDGARVCVCVCVRDVACRGFVHRGKKSHAGAVLGLLLLLLLLLLPVCRLEADIVKGRGWPRFVWRPPAWVEAGLGQSPPRAHDRSRTPNLPLGRRPATSSWTACQRAQGQVDAEQRWPDVH